MPGSSAWQTEILATILQRICHYDHNMPSATWLPRGAAGCPKAETTSEQSPRDVLFCLGAGSVGRCLIRCLIHWAMGPLRRNRSRLAIGKRTSSINAGGRALLQFKNKINESACSDTLGRKDPGRFQHILSP